MNAIEQYFHVVRFAMLYKLVLTLKSVDETLKCDHSNESYFVLLFLLLHEVFLSVSIYFYSIIRLLSQRLQELLTYCCL